MLCYIILYYYIISYYIILYFIILNYIILLYYIISIFSPWAQDPRNLFEVSPAFPTNF